MGKIASAPRAVSHKPGPHKPAAARPRGHAAAIALTAAALVATALAVWIMLRPGVPTRDPAQALLDQMHRAAAGDVAAIHAFGGGLAVTHGNGRMNVSAEGLPAKACVQVGWHLAKDGTIIVNGTLPMRLSAARLSELCSEREGGATLTWVPDAPAK